MRSTAYRPSIKDLILTRGMPRFDLLVTPAVAVPAFDARPSGTAEMTAAALLGWTPFTYPFNLTQQPACTVPCGLTASGLPIGLQFVGPTQRSCGLR